MKICAPDYTRTNGLYMKAMPDKDSAAALRDLLLHSHPPFGAEYIEESLHVTLMCSSAAPDLKYLPFSKIDIRARPYTASYWAGGSDAGYVVLLVNSLPFTRLHNRMAQAGLAHKYGIYIPHITVGMRVGDCGCRVLFWLEQINLQLPDLPELVFNRLVVTDNQVPLAKTIPTDR